MKSSGPAHVRSCAWRRSGRLLVGGGRNGGVIPPRDKGRSSLPDPSIYRRPVSIHSTHRTGGFTLLFTVLIRDLPYHAQDIETKKSFHCTNGDELPLYE